MDRSTQSHSEALEVRVTAGSVMIEGNLSLPKDATRIVLFAQVDSLFVPCQQIKVASFRSLSSWAT